MDLSLAYICSAGFGLACHLGVLADLPTIGVGKNVGYHWFSKFFVVSPALLPLFSTSPFRED
jgi:hypothetical protein